MSNRECGKLLTQLLETLDTLLGPNGCPWDRKQTYQSLRSSLLEETHEVLEALDHQDIHNLREELGDLLFNVLFIGKIAEKEKHFTIAQAIGDFQEKIIRRHPHVFGEEKVSSIEEVKEVWAKVKNKEKSHRKSPFEGIPKGLPALSKAAKMAKHFNAPSHPALFNGSEELASLLWSIAFQADEQGLDPESALREYLKKLEMDKSK